MAGLTILSFPLDSIIHLIFLIFLISLISLIYLIYLDYLDYLNYLNSSNYLIKNLPTQTPTFASRVVPIIDPFRWIVARFEWFK